ncbi:MAG: hypothetical protein GY943_21875 [Chloroflexi bacterium]|nr:hypothetical protein [Chloroflexota bacterium]
MSHTKSKYSQFPGKSRFEEIKYYQPTLEEALLARGWAINKRQRWTNYFWFIETWILQSQWTPTDLQIFLVFEDDEMFYSAAIALIEPKDHRSTDWKARLYLKKGWQQRLPTFLSELDAIRDRVDAA